MNVRQLAKAALSLLMLVLSGLAFGQAADFRPTKTMVIIAPGAPGGILDITSRLIGAKLGERLQRAVIVENVPGAGGILGIQAMLRAAPDGHTLVMGSLGPNAANYALYPKLPYAYEDLAPVAQVLLMPDVVVVNPKLPVKTIAELKSYAASRPDGLSMAVSTKGSSGHLAGAMLKQRTGINAVDVIYRGAAPALTDLISGQVDFTVDNMITALPMVRAGKLRALAVTTKNRSPELPDTPTLMELGYDDFDVSVWLGLFVSAKTPPDVVQALNAEINKVLADPSIQQKMAQQGGRLVPGSSRDFDAFVRAERTRWAEVIQAGNIRLE